MLARHNGSFHGRLARCIKWRACDLGEATSPTSQLILKPFRRFTYVTAHSPTLPLLYLRHSSFSNPSFASPTSQALLILSNLCVMSPTSQLILQPFRCFTYVTAHSPTLPSLYLSHSSFSKPSVASPTSQLILQPFFRFSYVTIFSLTSPGEPPMLKLSPMCKMCETCRPCVRRFEVITRVQDA